MTFTELVRVIIGVEMTNTEIQSGKTFFYSLASVQRLVDPERVLKSVDVTPRSDGLIILQLSPTQFGTFES